MKIFKEMPIVLPFYENIEYQNERAENRRNVCPFKLLSPENALLPFQIELNSPAPVPVKWEIITACGGNATDITNNLPLLKVYEFSDRAVAVYFGEELTFKYETREEPLKLDCGRYYSRFTFADDSYLVSEIFDVPERSFKAGEIPTWLLTVEFWNDSDAPPVVYRDGFKQRIYLDTFIHSAVPEIEEETRPDGYNNEIPVFQKLMFRYKFVDDVPDFIKIPFISLQMTDNVYIYTGGREGAVDRVIVTAQPDDVGASNLLEVVFEDDIIIKTACAGETENPNVYYWN